MSILWTNGCMDQDATGTGYGGRPRPRPHCARWEPCSPFRKKGHSPSPIFRPMSIVAKRLDRSRCHLVLRYRLRPKPYYVRWGPKRGRAPTFRRVFHYCGQTVGWIKMPLGTNVGLGTGNIVFDADPAPSPMGQPPIFGLGVYVYCGQMVAHLNYCSALS